MLVSVRYLWFNIEKAKILVRMSGRNRGMNVNVIRGTGDEQIVV